MENNKTDFRHWYRRFLYISGNGKFTDDFVDEETAHVCELVDSEKIDAAEHADTCRFCAGEVRNDTECFGLTDVAYPEKREGLPRNFKDGAILPLCIASCKKCRSNFLKVQYLPTVIFTAIVAAVLVLLSLKEVRADIYDWNFLVPPLMRPFFIFAIVLAICVVGCSAMRRLMLENLSKQTKFNIFDIEELSHLKDKGWIKLYSNKHFSAVLFTNDKPDYKLYSFEEDKRSDSSDDTHDCECCSCHEDDSASPDNVTETEVNADDK